MKESLVAKILRGFFILLPLLISYLMLGQLVDALLALTQPLIDIGPEFIFKTEGAQRLVAFGILILICIFTALVADTAPARRLWTWFENSIMSRFPPYDVLKSLSARLSGKEKEKLQPALLQVSDGARVLVAIVETLPDGSVTVFAPLAPTPALGMLQIVDPGKLEELQCSMADALGWTMNWGAGTEALLGGVKDGAAEQKPRDT